MYARGRFPPGTHTYITVVGSRRHSEYGKQACQSLIRSLSGLPVVIVSGLALGIDSIAHRTALESGIPTVAIPGSGLDEASLYPASHANLAREILSKGGALLSPFPDGTLAANWTFPTRNAIMAGISQATLVIEAERKSGTLITSKHAGDFSRDVLAVPGSIFSRQSDGPHMLIRSGATPVTNGDELREALGFPALDENTSNPATKDLFPSIRKTGLSSDETKIIDLLEREPLSRDDLFSRFEGSIQDFNAALSLLEIKQLVAEKCGRIMLF
jgi:DNA processing protein